MNQRVMHNDPGSVILDGIELVYDTFGEPSAAPMLLAAGLGMQMIDWDIDTADAIPGAKLMIIRGMGHGLPPPVWSQVIDASADRAV